MAIFKTKNLTYFYPNSEESSVNDLNLEVDEGELVLLIGPSGCGKSTLLKVFAGLVPNFYGGTIAGEVWFKDREIKCLKKTLAPQVGILFQDPEKQLVMTDVEREIVFGMENSGLPSAVMKRRLAETLDFIGIRDLVGRKVAELSAGQKQKVALAAILAMDPEVLLLDEPTSQMDPVSAEELLNTIRKIAEDTGKTIIIAEQKLERCLHLADRVIAMQEGKIIFQGETKEYCNWAVSNNFEFIPSIPRLFGGCGFEDIPITVKQGRMAISKKLKAISQKPEENEQLRKDSSWGGKRIQKEKPEIKVKNLWFSYENKQDVLKNINLEIYKGQFVSVLGQNGAGKSTLVKNFNGLLKPSRGHIEIQGQTVKGNSVYELSKKIGFLGQNPDNYLLNDSVEEEIKYTLNNFKLEWNKNTDELMERLGLDQYKTRNPRDLSTGQRQRTALASVLSVRPDILILDEPTRGMDYERKSKLGNFLCQLKTRGTTIVVITHDIEFAVEYCDRAVIMFNGEIVADGNKRDVLKDNLYYSSQINKVFYGFEEVVTFEEAMRLIEGTW